MSVNTEYDVVICGAGLAGLTLARQITRELPGISLLLIEGRGDKERTGAIQVGESTVEASAQYLVNTLDLKDYLRKTHYRKWGFRFFFGDGGDRFQNRPELGITTLATLPSYQLDRALIEKDLKQINALMGIQMIADGKVVDIDLSKDGRPHEITWMVPTSKQRYTVRSRWVIDAMGRRRFLQKKLGIAKPQNPHFSASWFRLAGRIDIDDLVPSDAVAWHARVPDKNRYYSTNHLMGNGRWVWLIPLASERTSIGIVTHEAFFPFAEYSTYEKALCWLQKYEPSLYELIRVHQPLDFQCLRHYSYSASQVFSIDRWACTGDAATFSDPFLSPGIDQLGFANTLITEMIRLDADQQLTAEKTSALNEAFLSFHSGTAWITQSAYPYFGNALVCGIKLVWDVARGFSVNASQRFNHIYLDEQKSRAIQPILSRLFLLTLRMERFFKEWAAHSSGKYGYDFVDYFAVPGMQELYHRNFQTGKSTEELVADHQMMLEYFEEFVQVVFIMALVDTMPEQLSHFPSPVWLNAWGIGLDPSRWEADRLFVPSSQPRPLPLKAFFHLFGVPLPEFVASGN